MKPFNAEAPLDVLVASDVTPNESFFVRNHLAVPKVNEAAYELEITGEDLEENTLSLENLKSFPKHSGKFSPNLPLVRPSFQRSWSLDWH